MTICDKNHDNDDNESGVLMRRTRKHHASGDRDKKREKQRDREKETNTEREFAIMYEGGLCTTRELQHLRSLH